MKKRTVVQYSGANRDALVGLRRTRSGRSHEPPAGMSIEKGLGGTVVSRCVCGWTSAYNSWAAAVEGAERHAHHRLAALGSVVPVRDESGSVDRKEGSSRVIRSDPKRVEASEKVLAAAAQERLYKELGAKRVGLERIWFRSWMDSRETLMRCELCGFTLRGVRVEEVQTEAVRHAKGAHGKSRRRG